MKFTSATLTDRGLNPKRTANEDRFLVLSEAKLFLVADGVGGRKGGQVASQTVVDVFTEMFTKGNVDPAIALEAAVIESNRRIFQASISNRELEGMATTVVVLAVRGEDGFISHVGDSRIYRFEEGVLHRETEDHSEVGEAVRAGAISPAMAAHDPMRNVLTRAVGVEPEVEPDFNTIRLREGARFLLCSDGITRHIPDPELAEILAAPNHPEAVCRVLKDRCFKAGAEDNLTAVVVDFGEAAYRQPVESPQAAVPAPPARRIEIDLDNRPSGKRASTGELPTVPVVTATPPATAAEEPRRGRGLRMLFIVAVVAVAGIGIGRYSDSLRDWVSVSLLGQPATGVEPSPSPGVLTPAADPDLAAARVLFEDKRFEKAREQLLVLRQREPDKAEYHYWLGLTEYELKNHAEAIKELSEAARLDSKLPEVYVHLARAYEAIGDRRRMEENLRRDRSR